MNPANQHNKDGPGSDRITKGKKNKSEITVLCAFVKKKLLSYRTFTFRNKYKNGTQDKGNKKLEPCR